MSAAWIGLIGLVLGALVGGLANAMVEYRKQRRVARAGALLIADELGVVLNRMEEGLNDEPKHWWVGTLPTNALHKYFDQVAFAASPKQLEDISARREAIETWNSKRMGKDASAVIDDEDVERLSKSVAAIRGTRDMLNSLLVWVDAERLWAIRGYLAVAIVLVAAAGTDALFIPHADLNSSTVAGALESKLGNQSLVDCNQAGQDWSCAVYHLPKSRLECSFSDPTSPSTTSNKIAADTAVITATPVVQFSTTLSGCLITQPPLRDVVIDEGNGLVDREEIKTRALNGRIEKYNLVRYLPDSTTTGLKKLLELIGIYRSH